MSDKYQIRMSVVWSHMNSYFGSNGIPKKMILMERTVLKMCGIVSNPINFVRTEIYHFDWRLKINVKWIPKTIVHIAQMFPIPFSSHFLSPWLWFQPTLDHHSFTWYHRFIGHMACSLSFCAPNRCSCLKMLLRLEWIALSKIGISSSFTIQSRTISPPLYIVWHQ